MDRSHRLSFRGSSSASGASGDRREHRGFREHVSGAAHAALGYGRAMLLLGAIWLFGLVAIGAVVEFERRVDETRQAQVVIAEMRNQQGALISIAFDPAVASVSNVPRRAETKARLRKAAGVLDASVASLARLGHSDAPATIGLLTERYYAFTDRLATLVADNASGKAALELGRSQQPGGIQAQLTPSSPVPTSTTGARPPGRARWRRSRRSSRSCSS